MIDVHGMRMLVEIHPFNHTMKNVRPHSMHGSAETFRRSSLCALQKVVVDLKDRKKVVESGFRHRLETNRATSGAVSIEAEEREISTTTTGRNTILVH